MNACKFMSFHIPLYQCNNPIIYMFDYALNCTYCTKNRNIIIISNIVALSPVTVNTIKNPSIGTDESQQTM